MHNPTTDDWDFVPEAEDKVRIDPRVGWKVHPNILGGGMSLGRTVGHIDPADIPDRPTDPSEPEDAQDD